MENKQDLRWLGVWIKLERLKRNWSQEGLCHGLCAVSYLSKIEQGKVPAPNPDLMRLLCKRLDGAWEDDPAVLAPLESRVEETGRKNHGAIACFSDYSSGGFLMLLYRWLEEGMEGTPEDYAAKVCAALMKFIRPVSEEMPENK